MIKRLVLLIAFVLPMLASAASWDGQKPNYWVATMDQNMLLIPVPQAITGPNQGPQYLMWLTFLPTNPAVNAVVVSINYTGKNEWGFPILVTVTKTGTMDPGGTFISLFFANIQSSQIVGTPHVILQVVQAVVSEDIPLI